MSPRAAPLFRLLSDRSGATLIEVLVAVVILTTVAGLVMRSTFQVLSVRCGWQDNVTVDTQLRHAGSWFARDALNAVTSTLADLQSDNASTTMSWTATTGVSHTAKYTLVGATTPKTLVREFDGNSIEIARNAVSVTFSRSGGVLVLNLTVQVGGVTKSTSLSPNPPKDTDGRREGSGRGWVRELQGRWPGVLG